MKRANRRATLAPDPGGSRKSTRQSAAKTPTLARTRKVIRTWPNNIRQCGKCKTDKRHPCNRRPPPFYISLPHCRKLFRRATHRPGTSNRLATEFRCRFGDSTDYGAGHSAPCRSRAPPPLSSTAPPPLGRPPIAGSSRPWLGRASPSAIMARTTRCPASGGCWPGRSRPVLRRAKTSVDCGGRHVRPRDRKLLGPPLSSLVPRHYEDAAASPTLRRLGHHLAVRSDG